MIPPNQQSESHNPSHHLPPHSPPPHFPPGVIAHLTYCSLSSSHCSTVASAFLCFYHAIVPSSRGPLSGALVLVLLMRHHVVGSFNRMTCICVGEYFTVVIPPRNPRGSAAGKTNHQNDNHVPFCRFYMIIVLNSPIFVIICPMKIENEW